MTTMSVPGEVSDYNWGTIFDDGDEPQRYGASNSTKDPANPIARQVLKGVHYRREDIARVVAISDGENDDRDWLGLFEMRIPVKGRVRPHKPWSAVAPEDGRVEAVMALPGQWVRQGDPLVAVASTELAATMGTLANMRSLILARAA